MHGKIDLACLIICFSRHHSAIIDMVENSVVTGQKRIQEPCHIEERSSLSMMSPLVDINEQAASVYSI